MAKLSTKEIIDAVKEMKILEVKELVDALKEEFGVDAATKTVVLKDAGTSKVQVIKLIREITGLGLVEAKGVADNGGNVKENLPAEEANKIKAQLEEAGATVELA